MSQEEEFKIALGTHTSTMQDDISHALFILICEILDNEHDLNRASEQISPLYMYCYAFMKGHTYWDHFKHYVYEPINRTKPMSKNRILKNMREILTLLYNGSYNEEVILTGKFLHQLSEHVASTYPVIGFLIAETFRGAKNTNAAGGASKQVTIKRSSLTSIFDNTCAMGFEDIPNKDIIGENLNDPRRVYPNVFPKAASVFVYKGELTKKNINIIIALIQNNRNSIMPFDTSEELPAITDGLGSFIVQIEPPSLAGEGPFLLHIFKNHDDGNFTFSLQTGQLTLNQVTTQIGWGAKRGSCLGANLTDQINTMIFSENMDANVSKKIPENIFMKSCHASYGKLCGDGVTIYATSECVKNLSLPYTDKIPGLLSIDEFCCLRAMVSLGSKRIPVAAFQQRPSILADTGLGVFGKTRSNGLFWIGEIKYTQEQQDAAYKKAQTDALNAAANNLLLLLSYMIDPSNNILSQIDIAAFIGLINDAKIFVKDNRMETDDIVNLNSIFTLDAPGIIKLFNSNTSNINKFSDFCTRYTNALILLSNTTIAQQQPCARKSRNATIGQNNIVEMFFANLGSFESFLETCGVNYYTSRTHIVYVMITRLFKNKDFTGKVPEFVKTLFGLVERLVTDLNLDSDNISIYINNYKILLETYNRLNNAEKALSKENMDLKAKLRKNIVILKYLIRALATCQQIRIMEQDIDKENVKKSEAEAGFQSPVAIPVVSMDVSCMEVFKWVEEKENIEYWEVVKSYDIVTKDETGINVLSPNANIRAISPTKEGITYDKEEDVLNDFLQSGDQEEEEECVVDDAATAIGTATGQATWAETGLETGPATATAIGTATGQATGPVMATATETATEAPVGFIANAKNRLKRFFGFGGSRNNLTRKRKPSKIPRRTIRRRGPRRSQKRTIRRQRRNKKGTQKRRK